MRAYARYTHTGKAGIGVVRGDRIYTADPSTQLSDLGDRAAALTGDSIPLDEVRLLPPIGRASRIIGATDVLDLPPESGAVDAEGELAVVIAVGGRRIAEMDASNHILGCTVANDVTVRDFQALSHQWFQG